MHRDHPGLEFFRLLLDYEVDKGWRPFPVLMRAPRRFGIVVRYCAVFRLPISINSRQWSLGPHLSKPLKARTETCLWKPRDATA